MKKIFFLLIFGSKKLRGLFLTYRYGITIISLFMAFLFKTYGNNELHAAVKRNLTKQIEYLLQKRYCKLIDFLPNLSYHRGIIFFGLN